MRRVFNITYFYGSKKMWETREGCSYSSDIKRKYIQRLLSNGGEMTFVIDDVSFGTVCERIIIRRWRHRDSRGFVLAGENISITEHYRPLHSKKWDIHSEEERCNLAWLEELNYKL